MTTPGKPRTLAHDWPALTAKAAELIRSGKVRPTFSDLAGGLGVSRATLDGRFRESGITKDLLPHPDQWPAVTVTAPAKPTRPAGEGAPASWEGLTWAMVAKALAKGPKTARELADLFDRGVPTIEKALEAMARDGQNVARSAQEYRLPPYAAPERAPVLSDSPSGHVRFAVASDLHIASKAAQVSAMRAFLDLAVNRYGCRHILVPGDVVAGFRVYRGQENEVYAASASDQLDALVNTVPTFPGVTFYVMGGNHDYSWIKGAGFNIVQLACQQRPDWVYMGYDEATVPLTPDLDVAMWHPSGGVPYALTYRGQKYAEQLGQRELTEVIVGQKERPRTRFVFWGHLHVSASFPFGPIRVVGPGCFEGRNSYLKQKGLTPMIQGVVIDADITPEGMISEYTERAIPFVEKEDDYHNAYSPQAARAARARHVEPLFYLGGSAAEATAVEDIPAAPKRRKVKAPKVTGKPKRERYRVYAPQIPAAV